MLLLGALPELLLILLREDLTGLLLMLLLEDLMGLLLMLLLEDLAGLLLLLLLESLIGLLLTDFLFDLGRLLLGLLRDRDLTGLLLMLLRECALTELLLMLLLFLTLNGLLLMLLAGLLLLLLLLLLTGLLLTLLSRKCGGFLFTSGLLLTLRLGLRANGRLGHGDVEDRKTPTPVEGLKDRHVKYIACGSNYSAAICLHKWVSGAEQSQCSACRQAFGFTRKRHNCYNCGLVHCHSCSSRKALRAALAPNPGKPYRVCDSCFAKLNKVSEAGNNRRNSGPRLSGENKDRLDKAEIRLSKSATPSNMDLIKQLDSKAAKQGKKAETFSLVRSTQAPSLLQLKDVVLSTAVDLRWTVPKPILTPSGVSSRSVSPFSRKPSPPRSATPVPTTSGLSFSKSITDSLKKTNELLNQEVHKLRAQVETLRKRCELQELELQKSTKKVQEAMSVAAEESAKSKAAKEVIKSLTAQLKDMAERLPPGVYDTENIKPAYLPNGVHYRDANGEGHLRSDSTGGSFLASPTSFDSTTISSTPSSVQLLRESIGANRRDDHSDTRLLNGSGGFQAGSSSVSAAVDERESGSFGDGENGMKSRNSALVANGNQVEAEWIEQYEPGVYITLVALQDGTRDLKRVRFSRRRFGEHQAETWWLENRERVYERYNVQGSDKASISGQTARRSEGALSPNSQM